LYGFRIISTESVTLTARVSESLAKESDDLLDGVSSNYEKVVTK